LTKKSSAGAETPQASNGIDISMVAALAKIATSNDLSEIEVEHEGLKIRVARNRQTAEATYVAPPGPAPAGAAPQALAPAEVAPSDHPGAVKSPMVGTAYLRANPESKPFVEIGSVVKAGDKILLVEAMKTFNEISAPRAGKVTQILVENGSPVEYDQALMIIE
jgi:acetyl-CoA carboxylase biotin carboxyl carrier protein